MNYQVRDALFKLLIESSPETFQKNIDIIRIRTKILGLPQQECQNLLCDSVYELFKVENTYILPWEA